MGFFDNKDFSTISCKDSCKDFSKNVFAGLYVLWCLSLFVLMGARLEYLKCFKSSETGSNQIKFTQICKNGTISALNMTGEVVGGYALGCLVLAIVFALLTDAAKKCGLSGKAVEAPALDVEAASSSEAGEAVEAPALDAEAASSPEGGEKAPLLPSGQRDDGYGAVAAQSVNRSDDFYLDVEATSDEEGITLKDEDDVESLASEDGGPPPYSLKGSMR